MQLQKFLPILAILSILPIWILPVAPLLDWPAHMAIAKGVFESLIGHGVNQYYYTYFGFLGYSLITLMLVAFQFLFSLEFSAKIVLSIILLTGPICWYYFFKTLDPSKQNLWVLSLILNSSMFFYLGTINFLLSINLALVLIAFALSHIIYKKKQNALIFMALALLVYMAHGYTFFISCAIIYSFWAYYHFIKGQKSSVQILAFTLVVLFAMINTLTNPTMERDLSNQLQIYKCAGSLWSENDLKATFDSSAFPKLFLGSLLSIRNPFHFLYPVFPLEHLFLLFAFVIFIFTIVLLQKYGVKQSYVLALKKSGELSAEFNLAYLAVALAMLLHFFIMPDCVIVCDIYSRSIPFFFVFLILSIKSKKFAKALFFASIAIIIINLIFQANVFYSLLPLQTQTLSKIQLIANSTSSGSTLFIIPAEWNFPFKEQGYLFYKNAHYNALIFAYNPSLYVSGMFLTQDTFILRSNMPVFDEKYLLPSPYSDKGKDFVICYSNISKKFDYLVSENITLVPNDGKSILVFSKNSTSKK
ncbi:MAG: hypothetical protein WC492_01005 [Candidatus Micrarchaeia archaeon]